MDTKARFDGVLAEIAEAPKVETFTNDSWASDGNGRDSGMGLGENDTLMTTSDRWGGGLQGREDSKGFENAKAARVAFDLDFKYEKKPVIFQDSDGKVVVVPDRFVVHREGHSDCLSVVSDRYNLKAAQPDTLDLIDEASGGLPIDRGFSFAKHARIGLQTRVGMIQTPRGPAECRALVSNGVDGVPYVLSFTITVVACRNTYAAAIASGQTIKIRHTGNALAKIKALKAAFSSGEEYFAKVQGILNDWSQRTVSDSMLHDFLDAVFPRNADGERSARMQTKVDQFMGAYKFAPASQVGTLFGLAQGITRWTSWDAKIRKATDRDESLLTTGGSLHKYQQKAFAYIRQAS